jgi:hypothetical protein
MKRPFFPFHYSLFTIHYSLLIVLSSYSLTVLSQQPHDYQLFRQDGTYFYHQIMGGFGVQVVAVRLDSSAVTDEGTEWYSHKAIYNSRPNPNSDFCYRPDGPSWIGWKLLVRPGGDNLLYGNCYDCFFKDTIIIKTQAMPGDSWIYIRAGDSIGSDNYATVIRYDTMTFLGITDSVKVIDLMVDTIILSKHHGLIKAKNFRDFLPDYNYRAYGLSGINSGDMIIGTQLLTYGETYDYEIGDIFHKYGYVAVWPYTTMYDIYEVLDKWYSDNQDTVFYRLSDINWFDGPDGTSVPEYDTLTESYTNLNEYVTGGFLPEETIWDPDWGFFYEIGMYYVDEHFNGRPWITGPYETYSGSEPPDTCYYSMGVYSSYSYVKGCGDLMNLYDDMQYCNPCEDLDYFRKGDEEWGIPFTIPTGISDYEQLPVKIYPVPAGDFIMIEVDKDELKDDVTITLSDLSGRTLVKRSVSPVQIRYRMDLKAMEKGVYLLGITSGKGFAVKKVVH